MLLPEWSSTLRYPDVANEVVGRVLDEDAVLTGLAYLPDEETNPNVLFVAAEGLWFFAGGSRGSLRRAATDTAMRFVPFTTISEVVLDNAPFGNNVGPNALMGTALTIRLAKDEDVVHLAAGSVYYAYASRGLDEAALDDLVAAHWMIVRAAAAAGVACRVSA